MPLKTFHYLIAFSLLILAEAGLSTPLVDSLDDTAAVTSDDSADFPLSQLNLPIRLELNKINNKEGLSRIAAKLKELSGNKRKTVNIVHIGDSHLQAGLVSAPVREWLQRRFGNAGRGLVFPYSLIKSNGPEDYRFAHSGSWTGHSLLRRTPAGDSFLPGISGYVAHSTDSNAALCVRVGNPEDRFNCIRIFAKDSPAAVFCVNNGASTGFINAKKNTGLFPWLQNLSLDSLSDSATITMCFPQKEKNGFITEGMVLLNGQPGVLYHSIGVNGAQVEDFLSARMFWDELPALQPDLIILSLGTNNAYEPSFDLELFKQCLDSLRSLISLTVPDCDVLITTLNDHDFRKKNFSTRTITAKNGKKVRRTYSQTTFMHNPRTALCNQALLQFCGKNAIAYWDIFEIMGGDGSIAAWVRQKAATGDHLHFTHSGYKILGTLLQKALEPAIAP